MSVQTKWEHCMRQIPQYSEVCCCLGLKLRCIPQAEGAIALVTAAVGALRRISAKAVSI